MPVVGGKKYPYTKQGIAAAARAKQRTAQRRRRRVSPPTGRARQVRRMPGLGRYGA